MTRIEVLHDDDRSTEVPGQAFEDPDQRLQSTCGGSERHHVERGARRLRRARMFRVRHVLSHARSRRLSRRATRRTYETTTPCGPWREPAARLTAVDSTRYRPCSLPRLPRTIRHGLAPDGASRQWPGR